MDGRKFVTMLPENDYVLREMRLIEAIKNGDFIPIDWEPVEVEWNGRHGVLYVSSDALQIGRENGVRISLTPRSAQAVADHLGYLLPTTHICDLIRKNAKVSIPPQTQGPPVYDYVHMHRTSRMLAHHDAVEKMRAGRVGLIDNAGKNWVLTNGYAKHAHAAANYGWFSDSAPYLSASGLRLYQPLGFAHNASHVDYSQTLRLVHSKMLVDGVERLVTEVGASPDWGLVSSEGPLRYWRIPAALAADGKIDTIPAPPAKLVIAGAMKPGYKRKDPRYLQRGDFNDDVAMWQAFLGIKVDRDFGTQTFEHTRSWQMAHGMPGLLPDGIVGPKTIARANEILSKRGANPEDAQLVSDFMQARHYRAASRKPGDVRWIVIHTAEIPEKGTSAEAIGRYFQTMSDGRVASAHFTVDENSIVQSVYEKDVAYHAPGANLAGIGIEHAGYAKQTPEEWRDDYSTEMLKLSARLTAKLCRDWKIPMRWVDRNGLLRDERGITTHNEVSQAFKKSTHYDPGKSFPMDGYIAMVKGYAEAYYPD